MRLSSTLLLACLVHLPAGTVCHAQTISGFIHCSAQAHCDGMPIRCSLALNQTEDISADELKNRASELIRRQVVESYCQHSIQSATIVEDAMVRSDTLWSSSHGLVTAFTVDDWNKILEPHTNQLLWTMTTTVSAQQLPASGTGRVLDLNAAVKHSIYNVGDSIQIDFQPTKSSYIYIFSVSNDTVALIFPSSNQIENAFAPGHYSYPSEKDIARGMRLTVEDDHTRREQSWMEHFSVVASTKPLDLSQISNIHAPVNHVLLSGESSTQSQFARFLLRQGVSNEELAFRDIEYKLVREKANHP